MEILKWRNQDIVRTKMYDNNIISINSHLNFIDNLVNKKDCSYWYVEKDGSYIGSYNITNYNEINQSCESGVFFKNTDLSGLQEIINMTKVVYDFSFINMNIRLMNGYTKKTNNFMVNLLLFFGFTFKTITEDDYVEVEMTQENYLNKVYKRDINIRDFFKYIKKYKK